MKVEVIIEAVSWKNRTVRVLNEWAVIAPNLNLKQFRVKKKHIVEVGNNLEGRKEITHVYTVE